MIDIIIPVYNSGKTIGRTLNSILEQDNYEDLVIYFIDDCSDDDYEDIIRYYSKYLNIKYFKLDKNSGPGVARQFGLDNSKNEYIVFIDSDDSFYESDSVLKLYNSIYDNDMAFGKMLEKGSINKVKELFHEGCLHGKMYRRSFINDNNLKFNNLRCHEDNAFNQLYLALAHKINYLEEVVYVYNFNKNSITNTNNKSNSLKIYIESMNWLFKELEKRKKFNLNKAGYDIMDIMCYCYYNYMTDKKSNKFVFENLHYLKEMYLKYNEYIDYDDKLYIYKFFGHSVIPTITFDDFIKKIK